MSAKPKERQRDRNGFPVYRKDELIVDFGETKKPLTQVARAHIVKEFDGVPKFFLVYNQGDTRNKRPPGYGISGGEVKIERGETPLEALEKHELGEIPFAVIGRPKFFFMHARTMKDRIDGRIVYRTEERYVFIVDVDINSHRDITPEEALEVSGGRFFAFEELKALPLVDTSVDVVSSDEPAKVRGIFKTHLDLTLMSLRRAGYEV